MSNAVPQAVGIDVGGTKVVALRVTSEGKELARSVRPTPADDMDIHRRGEELVVRVGSYKRNLILPQSLKRMVVREANFAGDHLEIVFGRGSQPADPERG